MQFKKPLPADRSPPTLASGRDARTISLSSRHAAAEGGATFAGRFTDPGLRVRSCHQIYRPRADDRLSGDDGALSTSSKEDAPWRGIPTAVFGRMAKAIGGFAACGEAAFPRFLFAVMSWMMAQALAGCLAYAEAMCPVDLSEPVDCRDPAANPQPESEDRDQLLSQPPRASEMPLIAQGEVRKSGPVLRPTVSSAAVLVDAKYTVRSEGARSGSPRWSASIMSLAAEFRSGMRRQLDRRPAISDLRTLDDQTLKNIGLSRGDIESFASRGDRCE
jgi:uncharacterized protein YjiS (DUF1127 family)